MHNSIFIEWSTKWLLPWVHYVPFAPDSHDLGTMLDWAMANDDEAQRVGEQASRLAHEHLRHEDQHCYVSLLLLEYSELYE